MHIQPEGLALPIRVLNWNILKLKRSAWEQDLRRFSSDANLVLLQESTDDARIATHLQHLSFHALAPGYIDGGTQTGVYTASSVRPIASCYQQQIEPWLRTPKAVHISRYALQDRLDTLLVINIHSINFSWGLTEYKRQLSAIEVILAAHEGPAIVAGDFNTWNGRRLKALQRFTLASDLDAVTFHDDQRTTFMSNPLDHIYVREFTVTANHVWTTLASDHNPLFVELTLRPED